MRITPFSELNVRYQALQKLLQLQVLMRLFCSRIVIFFILPVRSNAGSSTFLPSENQFIW